MIDILSLGTVKIDIHHMDRLSAKCFLENYLDNVQSNVCEVIVIHGYRGGHSLSDMVRKGLKHKKIKRKILSLNLGETTLILK